MKRVLWLSLLLLLATVVCTGAGVVVYQHWHEPGAELQPAPVTDAAAQLALGKYLVRAGNCMGCHTSRGGAPYAGGRAIPTPFGTLYAPNITPDQATGLGNWSGEDFWRALHNGKSRDGRFLYPAFPYPNYTEVSRDDAQAMYAYLRSLAPVRQVNRAHALRFPFDQRWLLAGWRTLYFKPGVYQAEAAKSVEWNRGAYLVRGLGHCSACHANRNVLGASQRPGDLAGGLIPVQNWYAPSLTADAETGLGHWSASDLQALLQTGVSRQSAVYGPMAEVVGASLQYLSNADIAAMTAYLQDLPQTRTPHLSQRLLPKPANASFLKAGAKLYRQHCADCHGSDGKDQGVAYPPLAGNHSLLLESSVNPIRIVLNGGFAPSTAGNPRPYGMPPFAPFLDDGEVAAVVSYIRNAWGNRGGLVSPEEVARYRSVPLD